MGFGGGGGSSAIGTSTDAAISNPATNNILVYSNIGKWQNQPLAGTVALPTGGGAETIVTNTTTTGSVALNLANGNVFSMTLTGNTTFSFSGATNGKACAISVYLTQDGTGSRTVTWPASVKWAGGTGPTMTAAAGATDILVFESLNGGTTWFGSLVGANFS